MRQVSRGTIVFRTGSELESLMREPRRQGHLLQLFVPGAPLAVTSAQYQAGLQARDTVRAAYQSMMTGNNLQGFIFPTTVLPARPIGEDMTMVLNRAQVPTTLIYSQNVVPGSYAGLVGLSMPIGLTTDGLPVGLELDNVKGTNELVLGIGLSME
jgi:indoleacetamide hydrolase